MARKKHSEKTEDGIYIIDGQVIHADHSSIWRAVKHAFIEPTYAGYFDVPARVRDKSPARHDYTEKELEKFTSYYCIISNRSSGKTQSMARWLLKESLTGGGRFLFLRDDEIEMRMAKRTLFNSVVQDMFNFDLVHAEIKTALGGFWLQVFDYHTELTHKYKIGLFGSLDAVSQLRGLEDPSIINIVLDEAISERPQPSPNRLEWLQSVLFSVFRKARPGRLFLLGNNVRTYDPVFSILNLTEREIRDNEIIKRPPVYFERWMSEAARDRATKSVWNNDNVLSSSAYGAMAIGNEVFREKGPIFRQIDDMTRLTIDTVVKTGMAEKIIISACEGSPRYYYVSRLSDYSDDNRPLVKRLLTQKIPDRAQSGYSLAETQRIRELYTSVLRGDVYYLCPADIMSHDGTRVSVEGYDYIADYINNLTDFNVYGSELADIVKGDPAEKIAMTLKYQFFHTSPEFQEPDSTPVNREITAWLNTVAHNATFANLDCYTLFRREFM